MGDERKMILQMLAEGKISADEADTLLRAIEESEETAEKVVVEKALRTERTADRLSSLGGIIDAAISEASRALDDTFRSLEDRLKHDEGKQEQLRRRVEERIRRSTERAVERAMEAEERTVRAAERAAARAQEQAERIARRVEAGAQKVGAKIQQRIVKVGIVIDKESVERTEFHSLPAQAGDRFLLESRVGDLEVTFHDAQTIEVEVRKQAWGADQAEAGARADATVTELVRDGALVKAETTVPSINAIGVVFLKDTRLDYRVRLPYGTELDLRTKAGDIRVIGEGPVSAWVLASKAGDIDLQVPDTADFQYELKTRVGDLTVSLDDQQVVEAPGSAGGTMSGRCGSGQGQIQARTEVGDIRLHH